MLLAPVDKPFNSPSQLIHTRAAAAATQVDNGNDKLRPMKAESNRLQSYINWPHDFLPAAQLAAEGFFYTQVDDVVKCAFCGLELGRWERGDVPANDHRNWSSLCPLVRGNSAACGNIPMSNGPANAANGDEAGHDTCGTYDLNIRPNSTVEERPRDISQYTIKQNGHVYPQYAIYDCRLRTFEDWPVSIAQKPAELAEAGFYYSGKSDKTLCFSCGGGLMHWETQDVPWEQHASWFPKCPFLRLHKSAEFIEQHKQSDEALRRGEPVPPSTNKSSAAGEEVTPVVTKSPAPAPAPATTGSSDEESTKDSQLLCKICYAKEIGVLFLPCGHTIACVDCAPAQTKCGVCRGEIEASVRAFIS